MAQHPPRSGVLRGRVAFPKWVIPIRARFSTMILSARLGAVSVDRSGEFCDGEEQEESRGRVPGLQGDGRLQLRVAAEAWRGEVVGEKILPTPPQAHGTHREEEVAVSGQLSASVGYASA